MSSDFPTFEVEDVWSTADDELLLKLLHSGTFSHHDPPHHDDMASDGVHTPVSFLDTPPVFLTVISLLEC